VSSTNTNLLPDTLEDIVVWALEHASCVRYGYLRHLQSNNEKGFHTVPMLTMGIRGCVLEWLVRIRKLGVVTSDWASPIAERNGYYPVVSVAGIHVCSVTPTEHKEIFGDSW
jgi:hypothetical protein